MSEEIMNIGSAEGDQVLELDINRLRAFKNHPFKVTADMSMVELKDSIEKYGILNPLIVRPVPEGYAFFGYDNYQCFGSSNICTDSGSGSLSSGEGIVSADQNNLYGKETSQ